MRNNTVGKRLCIGLMIAACGACGSGESGAPAPIVDNYLPLLSNGWRNTRTAAHVIVFQTTQNGQPTGNFTGTETHPTFGTNAIAGSWVNSIFTLTVARSTGGAAFSGKFLSRDTMRLVRAVDTLYFAKIGS